MRWLRLLLALMLLGAVLAQTPRDSVYGWLRIYAGRHVRDAAQDPLFSPMLRLSVPEWPLSMGTARNLATAVESQMHNSTRRVTVRAGRFLDLSGYRHDGGVSQSFFWVDLARDQAMGAVYVCLGPAGNCDQELLVFASQPSHPTRLSQLPPDFVTALAAWQADAHSGPPGCKVANCLMPAVLTQYFIGEDGRLEVLLHSAGGCTAAVREALPRCLAAEREASELDLAAAWRATSGPREAEAERDFLARRDRACSAPGAAPDCSSRENEQRAAALLAHAPAATAPRPFPPPLAAARFRTCRERSPVYEPDPPYTDVARRVRFQGSVQASLTIAPDGHVAKVAILRPIGYGLDAGAAQTLSSWRFQPLPGTCPQVDTPAVVMLRYSLGPY